MAGITQKVQCLVTETATVKQAALIMPFIALLLLGAHALRQNDLGLTFAFVFVAALFWTRQAWVRLISICALLWGGYLWADVTVGLIGMRQAMGMEWTRLAVIMASVIVFNAIGLWFLIGNAARSFFSRDVERGTARAAMFAITSFTLATARSNVEFPILLLDRFLPGWGWLEIACLGWYAQWVGGMALDGAGHRRIRPRIWAFFSMVFFGQLLLGLSGVDRMLMTGALHLPVPALIAGGPLFRGEGFFMVVLFSVTVLLVGPAWCSHLCYIGAWDDLMSRRGPKPSPDANVRRLTIVGRSVTLTMTVASALMFRAMGMSDFTALLFAAAFGLFGVGVMVFVSKRRGLMMQCATYCPMGLAANVLGKISPWRMKIGDGCNGCGGCISACRYTALDEARIEKGRPGLSCTLCGDCASACKQSSLDYSFPGLNAGKARTVFIVLVFSLHAVFLGVARI